MFTTADLLVPCRRDSCDVALPEHMSQDLGREILLWVDNDSDQRYFKWVGRSERCELNGEPVTLNQDREISAGDDLEVYVFPCSLCTLHSGEA
jgi:hypothetical protein